MHEMLHCLQSRLQITLEDLKSKRSLVDLHVRQASTLCDELVAECATSEAKCRERSDKLVSELNTITNKVAEVRGVALLLNTDLLNRSVAERVQEDARRGGLLRETEAKIEHERSSGGQVRLLRKLQGDLKELRRSEKLGKQQMAVAQSLQERLASLSKDSEISKLGETEQAAVDEIFPSFPEASPSLALASQMPTNLAEMVKKEIQMSIKKEMEAAFAEGYKTAMQQKAREIDETGSCASDSSWACVGGVSDGP